MKQCIASTQKNNRCQRPASKGCGRYCSNHFKSLTPAEQQIELGRSKLKERLSQAWRGVSKLGRGAEMVATFVEVAKELCDIFGTFLLFENERKQMSILADPSSGAVEKERAYRRLVDALQSRPTRYFEQVYDDPSYPDER